MSPADSGSGGASRPALSVHERGSGGGSRAPAGLLAGLLGLGSRIRRAVGGLGGTNATVRVLRVRARMRDADGPPMAPGRVARALAVLLGAVLGAMWYEKAPARSIRCGGFVRALWGLLRLGLFLGPVGGEDPQRVLELHGKL